MRNGRKVAMDIIAKHNVSNLEWLDEAKYQELLWHHKPLTDFWQIGHGIERRLAKMRLFDMYDVAHCKENRLYKEFGINAKYLINHAWGREDCTIEQIKRYRPKRNSLSNSQILFEDYPFEKARLILKEMVELGSLRLIKSNLVTNNISLYIGYSRDILPPVGAMLHFDNFTNVYTELVKQFLHIYDTKVNPRFMIRRIGISFNDVVSPGDVQLSLFVDQLKIDKERNLELAIGNLRNKLGKNAVIRGMNLEEGATTIIRNKLIGGHNAE